MNKKLITGIIIFVVIIGGLGGYFVLKGKNSNSVNEDINNEENNTENNIAIVYFSATGNTEKVAEYINLNVGGDLIQIIPKEEYTEEDLDYNTDNTRASNEQNDSAARPEIENSIELSSYDTIFLGYPIWWGDVPKIILTFLDNTDLSGKTVIPFCTSGGSGIETSVETLRNYNSNINFIDGKRLEVSQNAVNDWLSTLKY